MSEEPLAGVRATIAAARLLTVVVAREAASLLEAHGLTVAGRAVLERVEAAPATVPQMAQDFLMTRQAVQRVVSDLADRGYVEMHVNPRHRRSSLVHASALGAAVLRAAMSDESAVLDGLGAAPTADQWQECASLVESLAHALASRPNRVH